MHWINLASNSCGLYSSTGTAEDWYPKGASSNLTQVYNIFQLISTVSEYHQHIYSGHDPNLQVPHPLQETNSKRGQLVNSRPKSLLFAIKSKYHHHVLSSCFFPRPLQFVSCTPFSNSQLAMASGACPFGSKVSPQPLQRM